MSSPSDRGFLEVELSAEQLSVLERSSQDSKDHIESLGKQIEALRDDVQALGDRLEQKKKSSFPDRLLTREEAANRLRVSTRKLDDLEASGRLQAIRIGRRVLYHPKTLETFIRSQGEGTEK
jgi:excisionase family DNA binding protein